jgi:hypothetical protein
MSPHRKVHHHLEQHRRKHRHRRVRRWIYALIVPLLLVVSLLTVIRYRQEFAILRYRIFKPTTLPIASTPVTPTPTSETPTPAGGSATPAQPTPIPAELNLAVPFISQAPNSVWDPAHEEYCEEASALMAAHYFTQTPTGTTDEQDVALNKLADWQRQNFGYFESTTAAETKQMIEANFPLKVALSTTVDVETIKRSLTDNKLVIIPAAGRELGNPYFTGLGPIYHMLVIKGFTKDGQFITNDPGTRHGADYVYDEKTLLDAIGDYNHGDPVNGQKVLLIVSKR